MIKMKRYSALETNDVEEALVAVDNRYNEWCKSLTLPWQFYLFFVDGLRIAFEFPLFSDTKRHAAALYAIAENRHIREQLATEREQLRNQRQVTNQLKNDIDELLEKNTQRIREWKELTETAEIAKDYSTHNLRDYYLEMIDYIESSCQRLTQALKTITTMGINSEESLVFNNLQQHSSLVCYMQDQNILRQRLQNAKNQRLEIERIRKQILFDMAFLQKADPLEATLFPSFSVLTSHKEQA